MGIFDFLFSKKKVGSEKKETTPHRSSNQTSQNSAETVIIATAASSKESVDSFQKNSNDWSIEEKALLFAILAEISLADGEMHQKEKSAMSKFLFEAGVINDIMEVQDLSDRIYTKSKTEGDLKKIANDFKNLSSVKKEYIIKSVSELMEADGKTTQDELLIAFQLTGKSIPKLYKKKSVDEFLDSNGQEGKFDKDYNDLNQFLLSEEIKDWHEDYAFLKLVWGKMKTGEIHNDIQLNSFIEQNLRELTMEELCSKTVAFRSLELLLGQHLTDWEGNNNTSFEGYIDIEQYHTVAVRTIQIIPEVLVDYVTKED